MFAERQERWPRFVEASSWQQRPRQGTSDDEFSEHSFLNCPSLFVINFSSIFQIVQVPVGTVVHLVSGSVPSLELPPVTPDHTTWERSKIPGDTEGTSATANEESPKISAAWLDNLFLDSAKARLLAENSQSMADSGVGMEEPDEHSDQCDRVDTACPDTGAVGVASIAEASQSPENGERLVVNENGVSEVNIAGNQLLLCFRECQEARFRAKFLYLQIVNENVKS